jgi:hypothetical protein
VIDLFRAVGWLQSAASHDANIPRGRGAETRTLVAWAVTAQLSAFLSLVVLPLVLVTGSWQAPASAAAVAASWMATRHSRFNYLRVRII